jgi:hypothetical protein
MSHHDEGEKCPHCHVLHWDGPGHTCRYGLEWAKDTALAAKVAALESLVKSWSDGVDDEGGEESYFHSMLRDGACKQCYPDRDIKRVGWVCDFHQLRAVALGLTGEEPR